LVTVTIGLVTHHLVQFVIFWTSFALIFAKWQHLKHGYFDHFQVQQLSYIVLDKRYVDKENIGKC
jgi:hypothetical protein